MFSPLEPADFLKCLNQQNMVKVAVTSKVRIPKASQFPRFSWITHTGKASCCGLRILKQPCREKLGPLAHTQHQIAMLMDESFNPSQAFR